jgi:hypothetical protein
MNSKIVIEYIFSSIVQILLTTFDGNVNKTQDDDNHACTSVRTLFYTKKQKKINIKKTKFYICFVLSLNT